MNVNKMMTLFFSLILALTFTSTGAMAAPASTIGFFTVGEADTGVFYGPMLPAVETTILKQPLPARSGSENLLGNLLTMVPATLPYQVQAGDSLYVIAAKFGTDIATLQQMNNIQDAAFLKIGQELAIPNQEKKQIDSGHKIKKILSADLTAYTAGPESTGKSPGHPAYGITASGAYVKDHHTIAVDPRVIPMGTKVYIEGIGIRVAEDTGGAIKGNRIDVYMSDLNAAIQFGYKRDIKVYVLEEEEVTA
ncbi:3D domain-containing protein [Tumebacillus sp. DT12]|uniref:3D domain-containing protein n=1 Tax=Tumebacillus lacus TaxID=2995335 RepID=A0ABT3X301_9BACL|nr:3D domain-containing protein [Tumebacillus lacus]MCX7569935.1 3D domain-containing protein [Tumebacillus lacus]